MECADSEDCVKRELNSLVDPGSCIVECEIRPIDQIAEEES